MQPATDSYRPAPAVVKRKNGNDKEFPSAKRLASSFDRLSVHSGNAAVNTLFEHAPLPCNGFQSQPMFSGYGLGHIPSFGDRTTQKTTSITSTHRLVPLKKKSRVSMFDEDEFESDSDESCDGDVFLVVPNSIKQAELLPSSVLKNILRSQNQSAIVKYQPPPYIPREPIANKEDEESEVEKVAEV